MQNKVSIGILTVLVMASLAWCALLGYKVSQLEKVMAPAEAQQAAQARQKVLNQKFAQRYAQDQQKYTPDQLRDAETLYQTANQKWGTPEATTNLQAMVNKYPDLDRTGCAMLYLAQMSKGDDRAQYLQDCIDKYNDCFYGDGVQVGVYARFLLAQDCRSNGQRAKADALFNEIKSKYPEAIDHSGGLLLDDLKATKKLD